MSTTDDYLTKAEQREQAATEGPWEHEVGGAVDDDYGVFAHGAGAVVIAAESEGDAEFIAHARTDVPRLVKALRAVLGLHRMDWSCGNPNHTNPAVGCPDCAATCRGCGEDWPCDTAYTITEALGGQS